MYAHCVPPMHDSGTRTRRSQTTSWLADLIAICRDVDRRGEQLSKANPCRDSISSAALIVARVCLVWLNAVRLRQMQKPLLRSERALLFTLNQQ